MPLISIGPDRSSGYRRLIHVQEAESSNPFGHYTKMLMKINLFIDVNCWANELKEGRKTGDCFSRIFILYVCWKKQEKYYYLHQ